MRYDPNKDLLPDGEYDATIVKAADEVSKAGNEMLVLDLRVYDGVGKQIEMKDWITDSTPTKLRQLCAAIGHDHGKGQIDPTDVMGHNVTVRLFSQDDKKYGKQNRVGAYAPKRLGRVAPDPDADLPF